ncbi:ATP-binding protein [Nocardia cyriacigeorgica]|uniref:ATP-binding protein n=3 Tax=Nocardia cyriacigeorgica TaxID=135487 RepID=UPI000CEA44F0|nr:LuxR C-terminal-related transcriptional regulator [Nocardia cyriacigeorgica]MBF6323171.1 LuxR family transcriptional regulator [Nocardia cyriacigeorgica]PPJ15605.1 LuxR family transcriptional regulator [Nocardia cyriacigeorgica]TLF55757.1 LuxR family transcriptional regulator [Nocardia cyriacigeorgica]
MVHSGDHLTELSSYVGRHDESAAVADLLRAARLVSLTGPGGIGKTRLARRVVGQHFSTGADGMVFVELGELGLGHDPAVAIADRLGVRLRSDESATDRIRAHLTRRPPLLVLDNCEHLLLPCATLIAELLPACPGLTILTTSRQPLGVPGEQVFRVPPLSIPAVTDLNPAALGEVEAVRLFLDRAAATRADFTLTAENAADIAGLCRAVDGVPLAIELAAARVRSLSPRQILQRWAGQLALSTPGARTVPGRQRTLRAAVDWSYTLCTDAERAVWRRLSIFAGTFDLEAAEYVCADVGAEAIIDVIDSLVDKSLLERHGDTIVRYRMLRPLREYAAERLAADNDHGQAARRHRDWFHHLIRIADDDWFGPDQTAWIRRLRDDHADIVAAMDWSLDTPGEADIALSMACRLPEYWTLRGASKQARIWLDRACAGAAPDHPDRGLALAMSALHATWLCDLDDADLRLAAADAEAARSADPIVAAQVMMIRAQGCKIRLDNDAAATLAAAAVEIFDAHGDGRGAIGARNILALSMFSKDVDTALTVIGDALAASTAAGDTYYRDVLYFSLALIELSRGRIDAARTLTRTALASTRRRDSQFGDAYHVEELAWIACLSGEHTRSATLFGAAASAWERLGADPDIMLPVPHRMFWQQARQALGSARFETAYQYGYAMSPDYGRRYALDDRSRAVNARECPLSPREMQVAELIAQGATNREIAERLVIAVRTADTHVQHILTKLGAANRAQIAAWFTANTGYVAMNA